MYDVLKSVPLFADLPEADLKRLCEEVEEVTLSSGQELFAEGSPGDRAYVVTKGELEVVKASTGREVLLNVLGPGEVVGEMALLEHKPRMASVRARTDSVLLAISQEQLDRLVNTSLSAARAMFYTVLARLRTTEAMLRQGEKMAQLGTLTAGVAHELNNPAAAVKRGADQLRDTIVQFEQAERKLGASGLTEAQHGALRVLGQDARERAARPALLDALARSDREQELEEWLQEQGLDEAWDLAPTLVEIGYDRAGLVKLAEEFEAGQFGAVVGWLNATSTLHALLKEIGEGAGRISEIVKALKSYSYLDQAPVQSVDVHEGLDNTLVILRGKLNEGISVRREYQPDLAKIQAYGSELNQVWTNIIDNAADALKGKGEIVLWTRQEGSWVIVEIEDNGPGIPPEVQSRVFDAFFTTKPPGQGTGMGLDISYNIVVHKHRGDIKLFSEPGKTTFQVSLPLNFDAR